ncbi:RDD family protein [Nocardia nova]|nr:RDD family protein [Nocardia nova]
MGWPRTLGLLIGLACAPLCVLLVALRDSASSHAARTALSLAMMVAAVVFTIGITVGGGMVWIHRRRKRALRRNPWTVWPINYISTGRYEWVELLDPQRQPISALISSTWRKDIGKLVGHETTEVWFAGDPQKYGVISRPGGGDLRYAYYSPSRQPPRFTFRAPGREREQRPSGYVMAERNGRMVMEQTGRAAPESIRHGSRSDPNYPSPRMVRRVSAFVLDATIHLACGVTLGVLASPHFSTAALRAGDREHLGLNIGLVVLGWLAASLVDRVVIQAVVHTTVGKSLFGLVALRPDTGRYPSFGRLLAIWLFDVYLPLAIIGNGIGPDHPEHYFLTAVRRRDIRE